MMRGRSLALLWLVVPAAWLAGAAGAAALGVNVHASFFGFWTVGGLLAALLLLGATLSWLFAQLSHRRD